MRDAQKAAIAVVAPWRMVRLVAHRQVRWDGVVHRSFEPANPGASRRPAAGGRRIEGAARHALIGVVSARRADHRADEDALVGDGGNLRKNFADFDASDIRFDRGKLAANLGW